MTDLRELHSLEDTKNELKKANLIKDELISMISHELRTPLTSIR
jgi:signal transduction histidine kinase